MAAAEGLVQGPASIGAELVVVMVTWSICSPCISLRRARRRSKDDWVPLCRASRLVLSSRHFCQGRGGHREEGVREKGLRTQLCRPPGAATPRPSLPKPLPFYCRGLKETRQRASQKPGSGPKWN